MDTPPFHICRLDLPAGHSRLLQFPAGACIRLERGRLTLVASPRWLADSAISPAHRLARGQTHVVEQRGWFRLDVIEAAELVCQLPQAVPFASRWTAWCRASGLRWRRPRRAY